MRYIYIVLGWYSMKNIDMMNELLPILLCDEDYQYWMEQIRELEPDYLSIRDGLTEDQKDLLDAYISACESQDDIRIYCAYELGRKHEAMSVVQ